MSQGTQRHEMTKKRVLYELPSTEAVTVRRDVEYRASDSGPLTLDVYSPPEPSNGERRPAIVFVLGYVDRGAEGMLGCKFKEMESFLSWARLVAASGMVALLYTNGTDPAADARALLRHVRENAASLGVDETRIGLWACSGHVPTALSVLIEEPHGSLRCGVLCYGYTLDLDGLTRVAEAAQTWRFVNPAAGRSVADLPPETALFLARAGKDETAHLNEALDRFLAHAVARNLPITFVNHPTGPHAFDILEDSEATREVIRQILAFLRFQLLG
jgi:acetyl esterase/lipase